MKKFLWLYWIGLLAIAMASLSIVNIWSISQNNEKAIHNTFQKIYQHITQKFLRFDEILYENEQQISLHFQKVLPQIYAELKQLPHSLSDIPPEVLRSIADRYQVNEIYIIDPSTRITTSSFLPDIGFELGTISQEFREYLEAIFLKDKVIIDRINVSSKSGVINKYAYFGPQDKEFIIEASIEIKDYLTQTKSKKYSEFIFDQFFTDIGEVELLPVDISIIFVNKLNTFPFIGKYKEITPHQLKELENYSTLIFEENDKLTKIQKIVLTESRLNGAEYLLLKVQADQTVLSEQRNKMIFNSIGITLFFAMIAAIIFQRYINLNIVKPIRTIDNFLKKMSKGNYENKITTSGIKELQEISQHINQTKDIIKQREQALAESQGLLEKRVEQRTKELEENKRKLEESHQLIALGSWELNIETAKEVYDATALNIFHINVEKNNTTEIIKNKIHPDDRAKFSNFMDKALASQSVTDSFKILNSKNSEPTYVQLHAKLPLDEKTQQKIIRGTCQDITIKTIHDLEILHKANHDPLTDLYNRNAISQKITQLINSARRGDSAFSVLWLDLDFFKPINDSLGHEAGDKILKDVANRLRVCVRENDSVARVGGDEFVILLTQVNSSEVLETIANKIITRIAKPFTFQDTPVQLGISIGGAIYQQHGTTMEILFSNADSALYEAKRKGRNQFQLANQQL